MIVDKISISSKDEILQEVWILKDALSAKYKNNLSEYAKDARKRQRSCGHKLVNLHKKRTSDVL